MSNTDLIAPIEAEWEPESGFLWKARHGQFDQTGFERTLAKLRALTIDESVDLPRRLVAVMWYMPIFLSWQTERIGETGGDLEAYSKAVTSITNEVERILGTP
jgi:hypothetical protein